MVSVLLKKENSYFFGINVYDYLNNFKFADPLILITIFVASVYLIKNLFIFYFIFAQGRFVRDVQFRSTKELYQNYLNQKYSFFLDTNTGLLIRNINSTGAISLCLLSYLTLVAEIILTVSMISYLLFLNFLPTFIPLVFFVIFFLIIYRSSKKKIFDLTKLQQDLQGEINKDYIRAFGLVKIIKIFNLEKKIGKFFENPYFKNVDAEFKTGVLLQIPKLLVEALSVFQYVL